MARDMGTIASITLQFTHVGDIRRLCCGKLRWDVVGFAGLSGVGKVVSGSSAKDIETIDTTNTVDHHHELHDLPSW
jgi:hypothetical protein